MQGNEGVATSPTQIHGVAYGFRPLLQGVFVLYCCGFICCGFVCSALLVYFRPGLDGAVESRVFYHGC